MSLRIYKAYTAYINKKLAWSIKHRMALTPTTSKLITKCEKAYKVNLLTSKLAIKELFKRRQAELNKVRLDRERVVQQFGTILVGDAKL
jgi:archaellum biogenesis protein FlaJ (TadC family)